VVDLERPRQRSVLAYLLLNSGYTVATERIIDAIWGEDVPATARAQVQADIAALRRQLGADLALSSEGGGYRLDLAPDQLDLHMFRRYVEAARTVIDHDPDAAAGHLRQAINLWRGVALDGITAAYAEAARVQLHEQRLRAYERLADIELALGRTADLVVDLDQWVRDEPMSERLRGALMIAMHRTGRRAEALGLMRSYRQTLATEHGLDPGPDLLRIERMILREHPDLLEPPSPPPRRTVTFLPRDIPDFTGRDVELDRLDGLAATPGSAGAVIAIGGPGGIGKTAIAVRWAHRHADEFPDGHLFVDMQSYSHEPALSADHALTQLLRQLGHEPESIPHDPVHARELYRSSLSGRTVLVLIDNAGHVDQVRPLLAPAGCVTLITSRARLVGLVARDGAHLLSLPELAPADAIRLVRRVIGERGTREPDAVAELAEACGRMPLALRIAAANIVSRAGPVADQVARLRREDRLSELRVDGDPDSDLRNVFDRSYEVLPDRARAAFRAAGCLPGVTFTGDAVAAALGIVVDDAAYALEQLSGAHLVNVVDTLGGVTRYAMHDLVRAYAAGLPEAGDDPSERICAWYLAVAYAACAVLMPHLRAVTPVITHPPSRLPFGDDHRSVMEFLDAEGPNLPAAARYAIEHGHLAAAWQMFYFLIGYFDRAHRSALAIAVGTYAVEAAVAAGDPIGERISRASLGAMLNSAYRPEEAITQLLRCVELARDVGNGKAEGNAHHNLGRAYRQIDRFDDALASYERALAAFRAAGDVPNIGMTLNNLASVHLETGRYDEAVRRLDEAMAVWADIGRPDGEIRTRLTFARLHHLRGDHDGALDHLRRARASAEAIGHRNLQVEAVCGLGEVSLATGDREAAAALFETALTLSIEAGDTRRTDMLRRLRESALAVRDESPSRERRLLLW
jgi:DNA-binding SARP family transcriptional activator/tetratricopeptide (TPR) repeat protein